MKYKTRSTSNAIAVELGIDNEKENCECLEKSFNLDDAQKNTADEGKDIRRCILEHISDLHNEDNSVLREFKNKLLILKRDILYRLAREERIENIQKSDPANPAKLIAALKWMVQKGTDEDIDILLEARENQQLSHDAVQLLDHAVKCISDRDSQKQHQEFVKTIARMSTPLLEESQEIRDLRHQEIRDYAIEVFEDENKAEQWLASYRQELGGLTPNDVIITAEGYETVKDMLGRIDYGVYA